MLTYEREARNEGHHRIVGVDEAGRGPLAGSVVSAALHFSDAALDEDWSGLTDSKKLSARRREEFYARLQEHPGVTITVGEASAAEIDEINILRATHLAMRRAAAQQPASFLLVDGRPVPDLPWPARNIIKGDSLSLSIAAASIIAKVTRDEQCHELARLYPEYGFERHKGYGTAIHMAALLEHGPCPAHRRSFAPVRAQCPEGE